jgi:hypothetical protein
LDIDCKSFGALKDVPADKLGDYMASCLHPSAAGNIPGQAWDSVIQGQTWDRVGLIFFVILCMLAVWQLFWAKSDAKTYWVAGLGLGILCLGYLLWGI